MFSLPRQFGRYTLLEKIGAGGQAQIYRATDENTGQVVAVKVLSTDRTPGSTREARFRGDMDSLAALQHRSIVPLIDYVEEDSGLRLLVMQYVDGGDLRERIQAKAPESPRQVLQFVVEIGEALQLAHSHGILHRDVKPANVLVGRDGHYLLTDFGIAKRQAAGAGLTGDGVSPGTPHYMSPEQGRCRAIDGRSDLYSLAVVTFELLTARKPFEGDSLLSIAMEKERTQPGFRANDDVPVGIQRVLCKALDSDPAKRHASVAEFVEDYRIMVESSPSDERTADLSPGSPRSAAVADDAPRAQETAARSRGRGPALVGAAALVIAATAGFMAWRALDAKPAVHPMAAEKKLDEFVFAEPPLPDAGDVPEWSPAVDVLILLDDDLGSSRRSSAGDVVRELLQPLAERLRGIEGVGTVSLPPVFASIAGPDGEGLRSQLLDIEHDVAVVVGFERVRSADEKIPGRTLSASSIRPAVRLRAVVASWGAEATFARVENRDPVLADLEDCERDAEAGLPSAIRGASEEVRTSLAARVEALVSHIVETGQLVHVGIVVPQDDEGFAARFQDTVGLELPGYVSSKALDNNDWTFREGGRVFARTSATSTRHLDAVELDETSHLNVWGIRQKADEATTLRIIRQSLDDWALYVSATRAWRDRRMGSADKVRSANDLLREIGGGAPVELRYAVRMVTGGDMTVFEIVPLDRPDDDKEPESPGEATAGQGAAGGDLSQVMANMSGSVYLPVGIASNGVEYPLGTAWVVGEGLLATNGHVVAAMDDFSRVVVRRVAPDGEVIDFNISRTRAHPGYQEFARLSAEMAVLEPRTLAPVASNYQDVFDVALITVEGRADEFESLGDPFPLASREEAITSGRGLAVAYMGFPVEASSKMASVENPSPIGIRGTLSGAVDATMGAGDDEFARILRVDVPLVGGASGSPLFRADGRVLGLVNAGAVIALAPGASSTGAQRISLSGFGYVQRVDALAELMDGRTDAVLATHRKNWRELLDQDVKRFNDWIRETYVIGADLGDGRKVESAEFVRRELWPTPMFTPESAPAAAGAKSALAGLDLELGSDGNTAVVVVPPMFSGNATVVFYATGQNTTGGDGGFPLRMHIWQGTSGTRAAVRSFVVLSEEQVERGLRPAAIPPQLSQALVFRVR